MSDRRYPDTVRVTTRRGTARGCGGLSNDRPGPGASLAGTSWTIAALECWPVRLDRPANVEFTRYRIHGSAGCNRFKGTSCDSRKTLIEGQIAVPNEE